MTTLVTSSPIFQGTLGLLFISVGFDLVLLLHLPGLSARSGMAGIAIAGGFAGASGITLKRYVDSILDRSTPEGLLAAYDDSVTVNQFRESVAQSSDSLKQHPLHELHELVMSALSRHEWSTAQNGIRYTERISARVIEQESARGNLWPRKDELSNQYFRTPLEEYLPRAVQQAASIDEMDLAEETIESLQAIGEAGIKHYRAFIVRSVASGLSTIFREAPDGQEGRRLRLACLDSYRALLVSLVEKPAPNMVASTLSLYTSKLRIWLGRDHEKWEYEHQLGLFYQQGIVQSIDAHLDHYGEYLSNCDIDWSKQHSPTSVVEPVSVVFSLRRYTTETTLHIFRFIDRNGEWPILMTSLRDGWREICKKSAKHEADSITQVLIRHYIDTAYIVYRLDTESAASWSNELARLKNEVENGDLVDAALEVSATDGMTPPYNTFIGELDRRQEPESDGQKLYQMVVGNNENYAEWINSFREDVDGFYKEYYVD